MSLAAIRLAPIVRTSPKAMRASFPITNRVLPRHFSSVSQVETTICACGAKLPSVERVIDLYKKRDLRAIEIADCKALRSYDFPLRTDCALTRELNRVSALVIPSFKDVVYFDGEAFIMLETLKPPPEGAFGDLTGDHGKQVAKFLSHCLQKKLISSIGSLIDVGGQNTSTVDLTSKTLGRPTLPAIVVDLSSATPAVSQLRANIKYAIGDAYLFFSSEEYQTCIKDVITDEPTLILFNNILNVLKPEDGWATIKAAWSRLRSGDYLFISGLVPEQLEKHGMKRFHQVDGIVEFHSKKGFYKSALLPEFADFVELHLESASLLIKETFEQTIEAKHLQFIEVRGYRLLVLRKA